MSDKILVTYATRAGSTAAVAAVIGETLTEEGLEVDVRRMEDVIDVAGYSAVVAGSAIRGGKWLPEAMQFMRRHQHDLAERPFAPFMVCITLSTNNTSIHQRVKHWLKPVRAIVKPVSERYFSGALVFDKLPPSFGKLRMQIAAALGIWKGGDHRDWNTIKAWAHNLAPKLHGTPV